jgi:hypothetical protein
MIKISLSKEEVVPRKTRFATVRYRIELEDYADNGQLNSTLERMQNAINEHIEKQKKKDAE